MTCAMLIRGVSCTLSLGYKDAPPLTCPICFGSTSEAHIVYLNATFNVPLAMMMLTALIILSFWTDIYARCMELTKGEAAPRSLVEIMLSKPSMFTCSFIFTCLLIGAGHVNESCQFEKCGGLVSRFFYNIVVVLWLLQYAIFCVYWGRRVTSVISSAQNSALLSSNYRLNIPNITLFECFKITWEPFAAAVHLPSCSRQNMLSSILLPSETSSGVSIAVFSGGESSPNLPAMNQAAQHAIAKLRTALARVRYVQFIAMMTVILTVIFLAVGTALGYYSSGADPAKYYTFLAVLRYIEIMYGLGTAVFLA